MKTTSMDSYKIAKLYEQYQQNCNLNINLHVFRFHIKEINIGQLTDLYQIFNNTQITTIYQLATVYIRIQNRLKYHNIPHEIKPNSTFFKGKNFIQTFKLLFGYFWNKNIYFKLLSWR